jgi:hypothetical protein
MYDVCNCVDMLSFLLDFISFHLGAKFFNCMVNVCVLYKKLPNYFPKWQELYHLSLPPAAAILLLRHQY